MTNKEIDIKCENCRYFDSCNNVGEECRFFMPSIGAFKRKINDLHASLCTERKNRDFFENRAKELE